MIFLIRASGSLLSLKPSRGFPITRKLFHLGFTIWNDIHFDSHLVGVTIQSQFRHLLVFFLFFQHRTSSWHYPLSTVFSLTSPPASFYDAQRSYGWLQGFLNRDFPLGFARFCSLAFPSQIIACFCSKTTKFIKESNGLFEFVEKQKHNNSRAIRKLKLNKLTPISAAKLLRRKLQAKPKEKKDEKVIWNRQD